MGEGLTVWLLQTGEPLPGDPGNPRPMRAMNLAQALVAAGHKVVLWSSSFQHTEKRHRVAGSQRIALSPLLELRLIGSPGYRRNIGPGRLWDHAILARNLARALRAEPRVPDVAFVGFPPIETAAVMARWLAQRKVPCMVDVKDQWPEVFARALPRALRPLGRLALAPYYHYARRAMRDATALSAMAGGFLRWAADFRGRPVGALDRVVPLTTPTGQVSDAERAQAAQWWDAQGVRQDGLPRVFFVGSHAGVFDMAAVAQAAQALAQQGQACQFVLCGSGPQTADWRTRMAGLDSVLFPGWVDRAKIEVLADRSMSALAPYRNTEDFRMSIPNKVIDALALGVPVLSPLEGEVAQLIERHAVGLRYGGPGGASLQSCITRLVSESGLRAALAANAQRCYHEQFSFEGVYGGLVAHLGQLALGVRQP